MCKGNLISSSGRKAVKAGALTQIDAQALHLERAHSGLTWMLTNYELSSAESKLVGDAASSVAQAMVALSALRSLWAQNGGVPGPAAPTGRLSNSRLSSVNWSSEVDWTQAQFKP